MNKNTTPYYKYVNDSDKFKYVNATNVEDMLRQGTTTMDRMKKSILLNLDNGSNPGKKVIPTTVENVMTTAANLANSDGRRKVFVTKYQTGYKPSKAVLQSAKENGVGIKVLTDSKIDFRGSQSTLRNALTHGQGFNQMEYHIPPNVAQITNVELREVLYDNNTAPLDANREIDARSLVMNLKQQFLIKNQSTNLPLIFTIHIVKLIESPIIEADLGATFMRAFYTQDEYNGLVTQPGKIPVWYQTEGYTAENTEFRKNSSYNVSCSNKLKSLRKASLNFRSTFEIVESFTHTIKPGDFWNFSHTHNCGEGIDREFLQQFNTPGTNVPDYLKYPIEFLPYTYGIIFQTKGKLCEAQIIEGSNTDSLAEYNPYIGTSPGQYLYEFKTTINYVRDPENPNTPKLVQDVTDETSVDSLSNSGFNSTEVRLPRSNWRESYDAPIEENIGLYVIPFTSTAVETLGAVTGPMDDTAFNNP